MQHTQHVSVTFHLAVHLGGGTRHNPHVSQLQYSSHLRMPVKARSGRPKTNPNNNTMSSLQNSRTLSKRKHAAQTSPRSSEDEMTVSGLEDADDSANDTYQEGNDDSDVKSLHSDALDEDGDQETQKHARKRKHAPPIKSRTRTRTKAISPRKRRKTAVSDEDEEVEGYDVKEGQQIVGKVIQAPKTGRGKCRVHTL